MLKLTMTADQASLFCERFRALEPKATPVWDIDGLLISDQFAGAAQSLFNTGLPLTKGELIAYANLKQWEKATGGYIATIGGDQVPFSTSDVGMSLMSGKVQRLQQPNSPATVNWQIGPQNFKQIAAADFIVAATAVADFVQTTFDQLDGAFGQIESGKITTKAQIDALFS